eukprot:CAMPEP_0170521216 /NCGR_PEP_ID=MMETSP0209-20121228/6528_1 /TAXON_ID=665100 ORGANISM="Litonotus pictus, Strain P1" /NCGR_SAMPLE_ID=MMETSP0209 /ASSEMBLY_ACC=CAM_ASM_000301 /LENGTH=479 /DNA_ID=CAMNT_0010807933 /DNA_START=44 /DNA_END=1483 /DNA_ORIENTATION=+
MEKNIEPNNNNTQETTEPTITTTDPNTKYTNSNLNELPKETSPKDNQEEEDSNDDIDIEMLQKEAEDNIDVEFVEDDALGMYDQILFEDPNIEGYEENPDNINSNILEEESFKNDEEYKKVLERKGLITKNEFPEFEAEGEIYSTDLHEKKGIMLLGDGEENLYIYNIEEKKVVRKEKLHKDSVISAKFSQDKTFFLTASMDGVIKIFNGENLEKLFNIEDNNEEIMWTDWHPKGNVFAFGTNGGGAFVYNAKNGDCLMSLFGHADSCSVGRFSPDGKLLLTGSNDKTVKIWELKNQFCKYTIRGHKFHKADILCLAVGSKKPILATGSGFNELGIVNYENGNILHFFDSGKDCYSIECVSFSNEDNFVVFSSTDNLIRVLELQKLTIRASINFKDQNITKMMPSLKHKNLIYMGTSIGKFIVYDSRSTSDEMLVNETLHCSGVMDFAVSSNEEFVFTSSIDRTINMLKLDPLMLGLEK